MPEPFLAAIGGGSGLAVLLRGLKAHAGTRSERLNAIVTVADDGGSSGRLRRELGVLPPGDIRSCLVALADDEDLLAKLFQYRFPSGEGLTGHSFGNLFLTALTGITGDFYQAILTAESILSVRGRILPSTLTDVRLRGVGRSGKIYNGESEVGRSGEHLARLTLEPVEPAAFPQAVEALRKADLILLGPGSLYTSVLPNLMIPGIRDAVRTSRAPVVLILNLMTQPGETDRMSALDHLRAIEAHAGRDLVDAMLISSTPPSPAQLEHYAEAGAVPVEVDRKAIEAHGVQVVEHDLLAPGELLRHDSAKLGRAVLEMAKTPADETAS